MTTTEDEPPKRAAPAHVIGQTVALLSIAELRERIAALKVEVTRLEQEVERKGKSKSAAEELFRRP